MKVLKFTGRLATIKHVREEDFRNNGVSDQGDTVWNVTDIPTLGQAWVSDGAASMLLRLEPNSWEEVPEEQHSTLIRSQAPEGHYDSDTEDIEPE